MKRSIVGAVLAASLLLAPLAYAQTTVPIGDPYTDTIQLWSNVAALLALLDNNVVAFFTGAEFANAPHTQTPPQSLAAAAATSLPTQQPATSSEPTANATSDQTTLSQNVKSTAVEPAQSGSAQFSTAQNNAIILSDPAPAFNTSNFVTQSELSAQLNALTDALTAKFSAPATATFPQYVAADGNAAAPFAAVSAINNLSNVTITNANLTASEIPDLSGSYLSLGGGTLTGAFNDSSTATSTFSGSLSIGGNLNFNGSLLQNGLPFAGSQWTTSGPNIYYAAGDVGIATTSPAFPLDVGGVVDAASYAINGTTTIFVSPYNWTVFGQDSGEHLSATGNYNLAIGTNALNGGAPGYGTIAIGDNALSQETGGWFDTAIGFDAFADASSTSNQEHDGTAIGFEAGVHSIWAGGDTIIGSEAMLGNTTGESNVAIGSQVLYGNLSATNTVAIGSGAAEGASFGAVTYSNQGGVYIGTGSGADANTGSNYNTFIGDASGYDVTTGADNIIIGPEVNTGGTHLKTGSNNILLGYNANTPATTTSNFLNIGGVLFGTLPATTSATSFSVSTAGMIGIGTSTPYSRLQVTGPDAASSTSAFAVVNSASTTVFSVFDGGNAELSGSLSQSSDQRLKTNVQSLDASSSLSFIDQLNPVTFNWIDPEKGTTAQLGFIAQQVQQIFPNLVSTTSATALTPDGTLSLNYIGLISPIVSAIQDLSADIASIENTIAGFAQSFVSNTVTANNELCVGSTCVTPAQFQAMAAAANVSQSSQQVTGGASSDNTQATDTPPVIQVNGDNPAIVQVGATYNDLGATIEGPQQDLNLGIQTFVNGSPMSPVQIDTSSAATDTIDYVATDQNGLTSTSTRTVIIEPSPSIVPTDSASTTTAATSTAQ